MRRIFCVLPLAVALVTLMLGGCGKRNGAYPAEGQVLLNGQPLAGAQVVLYPRGQSDAKVVPPRAQTGVDGRFRLSTLGKSDGAPAGEYAVTVIRYPMQKQGDGGWTSGPNDLPKKYASPETTDLRVQIGEGKGPLPALVLQTPKVNARVPQNVWQ
jgi:hypothetical protein